MSGADLSKANPSSVKYIEKTTWPGGFDPKSAGAILVVDAGNPAEESE